MQSWKQCVTVFPGDFDGIQDPFEAIFIGHGPPHDWALFCRNTRDSKNVVFLLTPSASEVSPSLRGKWTDASDPTQYEWSLLVGRDNAFRRFGLPPAPSGRRLPRATTRGAS
jgi:hypothetical protein